MWWHSTGVMLLGVGAVLGIARAVRTQWRRQQARRQELLARLATAMRAFAAAQNGQRLP